MISALLLTLSAEAGAQDKGRREAEKANGSLPPASGAVRAPVAEDLFGAGATTQDGMPAEAGEQRSAVIRSTTQRVDESGLRYFASQNNSKRVEKEIQRLKALYPDWTPPDDLFLGAPGGPEEQPFWDLFAQDKVQELRAAIAEKMKAEPKWKPSQVLIYKLERKESRIKLVTAYDARQWRKVIEVAASDPKILTCADMDVQWKVADAFSATGQKTQAFEVYRFILSNCRDKRDRLSTMKKSLGHFEPREVDILIAMGARYEDGTTEFDEIRMDVMRIKLGRAALNASADDKISAEELGFFERRTRTASASADASLLGWFRMRERDFAAAEAWFRQALGWPPQLRDDGSVMEQPAKMAEGRILALKGLEKFEEAEQLAEAWSPRSPVIQRLYVDIVGDALLRAPVEIVFAADRLARYELAIAMTESKFGAQAIGWYHFNRIDWQNAARWFQASLAWPQTSDVPATVAAPASSPAAPPAAVDRKGDPKPKAATKTAAVTEKQSKKSSRPQASEKAPAERAAAAAKQATPAPQPTEVMATAASAPLPAPIPRPPVADEKTAEGLAVALRNAFRFDEAEDVAYQWHEKSSAIRTLYIDIFAESLVRQSPPLIYDAKRLERFATVVEAARSVTGAQGLAWYHHDRAAWPAAIRWFKSALDWSPDRGTAKLAEGYSQSLRRDGQLGPATDVAYDWRDESQSLRGMFFDISGEHLSGMPVTETLPREKMSRFSGMVTLDRSPKGASALGWHLFDRKTYQDSLDWFRNGLDFKPEGDMLAKMREGYVLSLRHTGRIEDAEDRAYEWRETSDLLRRTYFEVAADAITRLSPPAAFPASRLTRFVETVNAAQSTFGAQAIGWYFHQRGDNALAADWFSQSLKWGGTASDPKTAQGYLLALIALGRMEEADQLAFEWHTRSAEFRTLYIDTFGGALLRLEATKAFPIGMLRRFEHIAGYDMSVFGSQAVGWYYYDRQDWANASRWFEASLTWSGAANHDHKTIEGFAQSIRYLGRREDAEDILFGWRDRVPALRKLYVELVSEGLVRSTADVTFSDVRLDRYAEVILADRDWFGAQGLAWYRHDRRQWPDAVRWFKYAREWSDEARGDAKMAEGLAFSLRNLDLYDESEAVSAEWKDRSPALRKLYSETVGEYLVRLRPEHAYPNERMERFLETVSRDVNNIGAQSAGWYYYARDMFAPAAEWLGTSLAWGPDLVRDPKTAEGYVEALRRTGRLADAEVAAWDWIDRAEPFKKIYVNIAAEVIAALKPPASFDAKRLVRLAELTSELKSAPGALGLAWYAQARSDWKEAAQWFERALEWTGDVEDVKAIEGYMIALVGLGRYEEAEALTYKWRHRSDAISRLYIDVFGGALLKLAATETLPDARLARYLLLVGEEKSVWGAQAAGWYAFDRANWKEAARWFEASLTWTQDGAYDGKTVEGFAQSIRYFARRDEAEAQLYPWRDKIPVMRKLYIELFSEALVSTSDPVFFSDERINRYAEVVLQDKDWFGAQGLAWYRHDRRQWPDAVRWFKYAREWHVDGNGVTGRGDAKMAEGLAFSLRNLDLYDESEAVSVEWKDRSPAMRKLYSETVGEYLVRLKPEHAYPNDRMRRFLETTSLDHNNIGAQSAGWYFFARDMFDPAAEWFGASLQWGPDLVRDPKTAEGLVTALRRSGRLAEAELAAFDLRDRSPALQQLYFEIAGEVIASIKPPADFPADRLARFMEMTAQNRSFQGALAIAWYMQARENWQEAALWFERGLAWNTGDEADPKVAEGFLVALLGLGRYEEAEGLVQRWRGQHADIARIYIDAFGSSLLKLNDTKTMPEDRLERFAQFVGLERSQFGAQSLAWYHQNRRNWADAARWFQVSLGWTEGGKFDLKSIEGFAQALRASGRRDEAEDLLYNWRTHAPEIARLYIDTVSEALINQDAPFELADARIDRFAQLVLSDRSSQGAQALAWYRYNRKGWADAVRWFKAARAWSADGRGDAKLAEGLAFALRNMDLYDESEQTSWEWRDRAPAVRKLYIETVAEFIVRLKESETYPLDRMARYQGVLTADKSSIGAQAAGWYYFGRNSFADAAKWFRNALEWGPDHIRDPKTAEGLMIALRATGRGDEAEAMAYGWRLKSPRFAQLYFELVAEALGRLPATQTLPADRLTRLVAYARQMRHAPAAQSLGWYRAARREWVEAGEWFKLALDWSGEEKDPKAIEGYALALRNLNRSDEAETLAFAWRDKGDQFTRLYIETVIDQLQKMKAADTYPADRLANFARLVHDQQHVAGAEAIGWYRIARNDNVDGEAWFRNALAWTGEKSPKLSEGYALSLRRQQKFADAEAVAYEQMGTSEHLRDIYRQTMLEQMVALKPPAALAPERLQRFVEFARQHRQAEGARGLGWYHYDRKDWPNALAWFKSAGEWETDATDTKAAEGIVLVLKNMGKLEDAEAFAFEAKDKSPAMRSLYIDLVPEMLAKLDADKTFPAERLARFATQITAAKSAYGAQALAWYRFQRNDHAQALAWFKSALDWSGEARDPKMAEGYVLALRATGQFDLAEQMAYEWRDRADALRIQYVEVFAEALTRTNPPPAFAPDRLARYAAVVSADKNAVGAQALGWYSYNIRQHRPARAWFEKAMQWAPAEGSALGLALSARAMKDSTGYANIVALYRGSYPKLLDLLQPQSGSAQVQTFATTPAPQHVQQAQPHIVEEVRTIRVPQRLRSTPRQDAPAGTRGVPSATSNAACIARVEAKQRAGTATAQDMVAKGWCLLNADRPQEAAAAFERGRGARGDDPAYGAALARLRSGETDAAAVTGEQLTSAKKRNDIGLQVLSQRAIAANRAGRHVEVLHNLDKRAAFASETRDLSMMRGWALWNLGRKDAARRIFTELDRQLSTNETQSALGVVNEVRGN